MWSPMTDFKDSLKREHFVMEIFFLRGFLPPFEILDAFPRMLCPFYYHLLYGSKKIVKIWEDEENPQSCLVSQVWTRGIHDGFLPL